MKAAAAWAALPEPPPDQAAMDAIREFKERMDARSGSDTTSKEETGEG